MKKATKRKPAARAIKGPKAVGRIAEGLRGLAEPIGGLVPDPQNARTHDEANLASIAASLTRYGQRTPLVVNRAGRVILKGNATLEAAKRLGWTELAVLWVKDDAYLDGSKLSYYGSVDPWNRRFFYEHIQGDAFRPGRRCRVSLVIYIVGFDRGCKRPLIGPHSRLDRPAAATH